MRILHIISSLKIGGAEAAFIALLEQLLKQPNQQHIVAYFYPGPHTATLARMGVQAQHITGLARGYDPIGYCKLRCLVDALKPDIIHSALWTANVLGRLLGKEFGIPVISELHGNPGHEGAIRNFLERRTAHLSDAIVAVSNSVKRQYESCILDKLPAERQAQVRKKLMLIRNGIDIAALHKESARGAFSKSGHLGGTASRAAYGLHQHDFLFGSIGRFEPIKSYHVLIESFALLRQTVDDATKTRCKLMLVGDGSQRAALEALSKQRGIDNCVIFTGFQTEVASFYPMFDCFVLSSQSEGLSIALLQALACGVPVVTTHLEAEHDAVEPGVNGFLVPPNDPVALARAMGNVLRLRQHGELAKISLDESFDLKYVSQAHTALYEKLVRR